MVVWLQSRHAASAIILCKLLDLHGRGPLQLFCPNFVNPATHSYRLRSLTNDSLLFSTTIQFNSLSVQEKFYWCIWAAISVELRLRGADQRWSTVIKLMCMKCHCR